MDVIEDGWPSLFTALPANFLFAGEQRKDSMAMIDSLNGLMDSINVEHALAVQLHQVLSYLTG